jgi:LDH2 family malate/lactate/ureidoglycolate dehydrogenase
MFVAKKMRKLEGFKQKPTKTTNCCHFVCFLPKSWQKLKTSEQKMQKIIFEVRSACTTIITPLQSL